MFVLLRIPCQGYFQLYDMTNSINQIPEVGVQMPGSVAANTAFVFYFIF